jgi:MFS family permease
MSPALLKQRTVAVYYGTRVAETANFTAAILFLYAHDVIGLSWTQAALLYAAQYGGNLIFSLIGGGIADSYGRRRTYLLGLTLSVVAFYPPLLLVKDFTILVVLVALSGAGWAIAAHAMPAALADALSDDPAWFRRVNTRSYIWLFLGKAAAGLLGGLAYLVAPMLPIVLEMMARLTAVLLVWQLPKEQVIPAEGESWPALRRAIAGAQFMRQRTRQLFIPILAFAVAGFFGADLIYGYYQAFFKGQHFNAAFLGAFFAGISVLSAAGAWLLHGLHEQHWRRRHTVLAALAVLLNGLGFIIGHPALVIVTAGIMALVVGPAIPTIRLMVSEQAPAHLQASVLAATATLSGVGLIAGFGISGILADHGTSQHVGMMAVISALWALGLLAVRRPASAFRLVLPPRDLSNALYSRWRKQPRI